MTNKRVLGFDASTTTIGVAVLDEIDGYVSLVHLEHFKPPKDGNIFEILAIVRKFIIEKIQQFSPTDVVLEDIILFMKGHSTAKTISSLAVLNRTVGLAIYNQFGKSPELLNVMKIRHALKITKTLPSKEEMPDLVASILGIKFPYIINKKGKYIAENYDRADAISVALAFLKITQKIEQAKPLNIKKSKRLIPPK
jgi:Holliday junction resolvasome RuvABC endonuclease subunit